MYPNFVVEIFYMQIKEMSNSVRNMPHLDHFKWFWWSYDNVINGTNVFIKCTSSGPKNEVKSPNKTKHEERTQRKIKMDEFRNK